ncbi:hypothetical protein CVIRNUC_000988 [Coccomyxa viridis]|uniref:Photosystem II manganese-stabilizing polypeptide n=1 Tax=Coccomyxa viridis TaxID=1274662 RepID=A0AAV1HTE2_9CHLO|nr:hypothetical protein CVIRNUC_000988 [Coccomyxa viridis]
MHTATVNAEKERCDIEQNLWEDAAARLAAAAAAFTLACAPNAQAITYKDLQNMTYNEVRGTGLAAVCPIIEEGTTDLSDIKPGSYKLQQLCLEPTKIWVKEAGVMKDAPADWAKATLLTRQTTNLSDISADMDVSPGGRVSFREDDSYSLNLAPITVQVPGGERVPFLFTIKELQASGDLAKFGGTFKVPSYRGSTFLDPKGRGGSQGYDAALALQTKADVDELEKENIRSFAALEGEIAFSVVKYNSASGEVVGVFESLQPSDTDMGSKVPKEVMIEGIWYSQLA